MPVLLPESPAGRIAKRNVKEGSTAWEGEPRGPGKKRESIHVLEKESIYDLEKGEPQSPGKKKGDQGVLEKKRRASGSWGKKEPWGPWEKWESHRVLKKKRESHGVLEKKGEPQGPRKRRGGGRSCYRCGTTFQ